MSFMVCDHTEPVGLDPRPFGKFGPFESRDDAERYIARLSRPEAFYVMPTSECK